MKYKIHAVPAYWVKREISSTCSVRLARKVSKPIISCHGKGAKVKDRIL